MNKPNEGEPEGASAGEKKNYLGSVLSLISKSEIRYVGTLVMINSQEQTLTLKHVKSYGSEGRRGGGEKEVPPSEDIYESIKFRATDLQDFYVIRSPDKKFKDPAIIESESKTSQSDLSSSHAHNIGNKNPHTQQQNMGPSSFLDMDKREEQKVFPGNTGMGGFEIKKETGEEMIEKDQTRRDELNNRRLGSGERNFYSHHNNYTPGGGGYQRQNYQHLDKERMNYDGQQQYYRGGRGRGGQERSFRRSAYSNYRRPTRGAFFRQPNYHHQNKEPIGELSQNPQEELRLKYKEDFDFEGMNNKFNDLSLGDESANSEENTALEAYNKEVSFFDDISSSVTEKKGRENYETRLIQREIDVETFGEARIRGEYRGRGGRDRGGNLRGRGYMRGERGGYNQRYERYGGFIRGRGRGRGERGMQGFNRRRGDFYRGRGREGRGMDFTPPEDREDKREAKNYNPFSGFDYTQPQQNQSWREGRGGGYQNIYRAKTSYYKKDNQY